MMQKSVNRLARRHTNVPQTDRQAVNPGKNEAPSPRAEAPGGPAPGWVPELARLERVSRSYLSCRSEELDNFSLNPF